MASDCLLPQVNITSARLFYMGALIIGYFVIFNLFIAILLDSFGSDEEGEGEGEGEGGEGEAEKGGAQDGARDPTAEESATSPKDRSQHRTGSGEPPSSSRQLQRFCRAWAENDYWEGFIILAIFASSVALVLDTPRLDEDSFGPPRDLAACMRSTQRPCLPTGARHASPR